jgi:hypothetical protein
MGLGQCGLSSLLRFRASEVGQAEFSECARTQKLGLRSNRRERIPDHNKSQRLMRLVEVLCLGQSSLLLDRQNVRSDRIELADLGGIASFQVATTTRAAADVFRLNQLTNGVSKTLFRAMTICCRRR